jgi:tripartite-type tricarboxylate transporter receptor subunit TctC
MAGELFRQMAGVDILHVPYKGSSPARIDVISGQVDMMFDATTTMKGFIAAGKVVALATTGARKSDVLPNLPIVADTVPGYEAMIWLGLVALNAAVTAIASKPDVKAAWGKDGAVPMIMDPSQFKTFLDADVTKWATVVRISGAKVGQ